MACRKDMIMVLTINDDINYGNRLQNYALVQLLNEYSKCETANLLVGDHGIANFNELIDFCIKSLKIRVKLFLFSLNRRFLSLDNIYYTNCISFTHKFVPDKFMLISEYVKIHWRRIKRVERVVIGSDQVWNYRWLFNNDLALRLGAFVPESVPIISYAASFGVSQIPDDVKPLFQQYLPHFKAISVREDRGKELIKEMTGLNATVVLDPTLMLDSERWSNITRGFVADDDCYVLTYFLGEPSAAQERTIQKYAHANGCRVRRIRDLRDTETYIAGPQDFVELFSKARYVFTDSYHACCFSILFHKQFTVFNRAGMEGNSNMNSRMETLFRLFDLDTVVMDDGVAPKIDYRQVERLLRRHRAESRSWLDTAVGV